MSEVIRNWRDTANELAYYIERQETELTSLRDQLRVAREALEKAWLELEAASEEHHCKSCGLAATHASDALSLLPKEGEK